jgi:3-methyladenine DNA glycosylase AlkC
MAEALKDQYTLKFPQKIALQISNVYPAFQNEQFLKDVSIGYDNLELLQRAQHIATILQNYLPNDYLQAIKILINSLGDKLIDDRSFGIESFLYMPHSYFIQLYGLDYFDESINAMYEITQRFTAEFCIRYFIQKYPEQTLKKLQIWSQDNSLHVRRLVSEGVRPRLPWAIQLKEYVKDPSSILFLLETLKDDKELYVRRSVANNLNDISKDNPDITLNICKKWMEHKTKDREWIIKHALRTLIKKGDPTALEILGFGNANGVDIIKTIITPNKPKIGEFIEILIEIKNSTLKEKKIMVDFSIDYVKANNKSSKKVFKLKSITLKPNESNILKKRVSLKEMTTRKHYEGVHNVFLHLNGEISKVGSFNLISM